MRAEAIPIRDRPAPDRRPRHRLGAAALSLVALITLLVTAPPAAAREPSVPLDRLLPAEFLGVVRLRDGDSGAVALRVGAEPSQQRTVPIFIGPTEAAAIARQQRGERPHRPLTHELLADLFPATGLLLRRVVIDDLRDGTFFATLEVAVGERTVWIDARPSDGIALALARKAPIYVGPRVAASEPDPIDPPPPAAVQPAGHLTPR